MQDFILNLLGSLMLLYGLFSYTLGVTRAVVLKVSFKSWDANIAIFYAALGLSVLLTF
jgi:hypothetical protein